MRPLSMIDMLNILNQADTDVTKQLEAAAIETVYPCGNSTVLDERNSCDDYLGADDYSCPLNFERD